MIVVLTLFLSLSRLYLFHLSFSMRWASFIIVVYMKAVVPPSSQERETHHQKTMDFHGPPENKSSSLTFTIKTVAKDEDEGSGEKQELYGGDFKFETNVQLKKKKTDLASGSGRRGSGSGATGGGMVSPPSCQVEKCAADLSGAKKYHQRHRVCEFHAKALVVVICGLRQRFCQQCSRFHEVSEFDETKRSCRSRLAGHNERRRKSSSESHGRGSSHRELVPQLKANQFRQVDGEGRIRIAIPGTVDSAH